SLTRPSPATIRRGRGGRGPSAKRGGGGTNITFNTARDPASCSFLARGRAGAAAGFGGGAPPSFWAFPARCGCAPRGAEAGRCSGVRRLAHAVPAFLDGGEARGLGDKILLVMCGEMGRTPQLSKTGGRDHWGNLGPLVLAGGGLPMGQVIGRSTANGGEPADNPVHMRHLIGTIFHTVFDVGELRLRRDASGAVAKLITEREPIKRLIA